jgi:transposase
VLGASNFTYAEASWTQALVDWIGAHIRSFDAIGGVPNLLVPDNTKVAVIKACLASRPPKSVNAPLFGRAVAPRANLTIVARLVAASRAVVIPAYAERLEGAHFR